MSTTINTNTDTVLKLRSTLLKRADISKAEQKLQGDISSVFSSLGGSSTEGFPQSYSELKKKLIRNGEVVTESWLRLKKSLAQRIKDVEQKSSESVPTIDYKDLEALPPKARETVLKAGCVVFRNIIPQDEARKLKTDIDDYIKANPQTVGYPKGKEVVFELYWSKPQVKARADPRLRKTLQFMNQLWHASDDAEICLDQNLSYADRLRIRNPGDNMFSLGPHSDGGGIERWEDEEYSRCYSKIFEGDWESYDPFDATHRVTANMSLYPTGGACSAFRTFQGWLSMSEVSPGGGSILFAPAVREVTAYLMLRPFFNDKDELDLESTDFPGTTIGKSQEYTDTSHPDLQLQKLMVSPPTVNPGDAVFWHCDLIHAVDPVHHGANDSSVLYIPSVPLCDLNANYCAIQRESFIGGFPGPDFPGFPTGLGEREHTNRGTPSYVNLVGGIEALREFCLEPFEVKDEFTHGTKKVVEASNDLLFNI